jgi:hypothetical protein
MSRNGSSFLGVGVDLEVEFRASEKVLYQLSHAPSTFPFSYFEIGYHFMPRLTWITVLFILLWLLGMTGVHNHTQLLLIEISSGELLCPGLS